MAIFNLYIGDPIPLISVVGDGQYNNNGTLIINNLSHALPLIIKPFLKRWKEKWLVSTVGSYYKAYFASGPIFIWPDS